MPCWLSLLEDIDSSTGGFCAVLFGELVADEGSLSFTYVCVCVWGGGGGQGSHEVALGKNVFW